MCLYMQYIAHASVTQKFYLHGRSCMHDHACMYGYSGHMQCDKWYYTNCVEKHAHKKLTEVHEMKKLYWTMLFRPRVDGTSYS